jgi:ferric iron reductase protein FhuF
MSMWWTVTERPSYDEKQAWAVLVWRACCQRYVFATSPTGICGQCWK